MIKSLVVASIAMLSLILFAGGPPSKGTPPANKTERKQTRGKQAKDYQACGNTTTKERIAHDK